MPRSTASPPKTATTAGTKPMIILKKSKIKIKKVKIK
jgi:hypothetical protein